MSVLPGLSPRSLSVCFTSVIGNVIPTFSVLSALVVPDILVLYIVPQSYKAFDFSFYFLKTISVFMNS